MFCINRGRLHSFYDILIRHIPIPGTGRKQAGAMIFTFNHIRMQLQKVIQGMKSVSETLF